MAVTLLGVYLQNQQEQQEKGKTQSGDGRQTAAKNRSLILLFYSVKCTQKPYTDRSVDRIIIK